MGLIIHKPGREGTRYNSKSTHPRLSFMSYLTYWQNLFQFWNGAFVNWCSVFHIVSRSELFMYIVHGNCLPSRSSNVSIMSIIWTCFHNVFMETFSLHQLILHVVGGDHFEMLCIYNACYAWRLFAFMKWFYMIHKVWNCSWYNYFYF